MRYIFVHTVAAKGEKFLSINLENLSPHQMDDITLNKMYFSAIPDFYRVGIELFEIFVVSVNEQKRSQAGFAEYPLVLLHHLP